MREEAMAIGSEEEEEEKGMQLYLQVRTKNVDHPDDGDGEHKWFVVNLGDKDNNIEEMRGGSVGNGMSHKFPRDTASACSEEDSKVFVCGGEDIRERRSCGNSQYPNLPDPIEPMVDFWYTDTYCNDDDDGFVYGSGWIKGPSMLQPRSRACAVVVDGKIYVFGGVRWPTPSTWAEVFDFESNRWSKLKPSRDLFSLHVWKCVVLDSDSDLAAVDVDGHKEKKEKKKKRLILVYDPMCGFLHSYDLELGVWKLVDSEFGHCWTEELVAVSAGTNSTPLLLMIRDGLLYGYHVGRKKWFEGPVSGLEGSNALPAQDLLSCINEFCLVPLGSSGNGKLCVLWSKPSSDCLTLCVHCTELTFYEDGPSSLAANVEPTRVLNLANGDALISCHALFPRRVKKRERMAMANSSMKLYLQVRTKNLDHPDDGDPDPYINGDGEHKWFIVNCGDKDNNIEEMRGGVSNAMSIKFPSDTASACSEDSMVFVCGGEGIRKRRSCGNLQHPNLPDPIEPMDNFWYTDTYCNDDDGFVYGSGWIKGPSMLQPRSRACAVVVDGKIYVFGGVRWPTPSTWAEVFDIKSNSWSELKPYTYFFSLHVSKCIVLDLDNSDDSDKSDQNLDFISHLNLDPNLDLYYFLDVDLQGHQFVNYRKKKKWLILVYVPVSGDLHSYDLEIGVWDLVDPEFGHLVEELVAVSGGTNSTPLLLAIRDGLLYGYHLGQKKWFEGPVSGLEGTNALPSPDLLSYINGFCLVPLGGGNGKLCVLWSKPSSDCLTLCVHCTELTFYEDGPSLAANVEPTRVLDLANGDALISCHALTPRQGKTRKGESSYMEED